MKGIATCYDCQTGKELWKERICDAIASSPIAAGGLAYFLDQQGNTVVLKPGPKLDVVARNTLGNSGGEMFRASLTPVGDKFIARSNTALYCIVAAKAAGK